ncbi:MAG: hypothetical protein ACM3JK_07165 [Betaproteobacteria bacterium]
MEQNKAPLSRQGATNEKTASEQISFLQEGWQLTRKAVLTLAASLLLGGVLISMSQAILQQQKKSLNQARAQRNDAAQKRSQAETDKLEIRNYQSQFLLLQAHGFIGEEKRLNWMENIRAIRENRKLLPISYNIAAQQSFQTDPSTPTGSMELHGSRMNLHMDLLHEMDLLNLLDDLGRKGFYAVRECTIDRVDEKTETLLSPRLTADCILYWPTLGKTAASPQNPTAQ